MKQILTRSFSLFLLFLLSTHIFVFADQDQELFTWGYESQSPYPLVAAAGACASNICYLTGGAYIEEGVTPETLITTDYVSTCTFLSDGHCQWQENPATLVLPRSGHSATVVWDSPDHYTVWVFGGQESWDDQNQDFSPFADVEFYDPLIGAWQIGPILPVATSRLGCASVNTTVFCIGGVIVYTDVTGKTSAVITDTVKYLDTANPSNGWKTAFHYPSPVSQAGVASVGSSLFVIGWVLNTLFLEEMNKNASSPYNLSCEEMNKNASSLHNLSCPLGTCFWAQTICEAGVPPNSKSWMLPSSHAEPIPCNAPELKPFVYTWDTMTINGWIGLAPLNFPRCGGGAFFDPITSSLFYAGGAGNSDNVAATLEVFNTKNYSIGWKYGPLMPLASVAAAWASPTTFNATALPPYGPTRPVAWMATGVESSHEFNTTALSFVLYAPVPSPSPLN